MLETRAGVTLFYVDQRSFHYMMLMFFELMVIAISTCKTDNTTEPYDNFPSGNCMTTAQHSCELKSESLECEDGFRAQSCLCDVSVSGNNSCRLSR